MAPSGRFDTVRTDGMQVACGLTGIHDNSRLVSGQRVPHDGLGVRVSGGSDMPSPLITVVLGALVALAAILLYVVNDPATL